jgi:hypothetical protein
MPCLHTESTGRMTPEFEGMPIVVDIQSWVPD